MAKAADLESRTAEVICDCVPGDPTRGVEMLNEMYEILLRGRARRTPRCLGGPRH